MEVASCRSAGNICHEDFQITTCYRYYGAESIINKVEDFSSFSANKLHH